MTTLFREGFPLALLIAIGTLLPGPAVFTQTAPAAAPPPTLEEVMRRLDALQQKYDELQRRMDEMNGAAAANAPAPEAPAEAVNLEPAPEAVSPPPVVAEAPPPLLPPTPASGGSGLKLIDISLDVLTAAGGSSETDIGLQSLQGGGHDPRKRGFTLQNVEFSLSGAIDPYFTGESHLVYLIDPFTGESHFELEEAFLTTTKLSHGLQVKAGQFFTEFGRTNPVHPHAWLWEDQPLINTRVFGPDGMRGTGVRLSWLSPLPWYSQFYVGVQNANGDTMVSFLSSAGYFSERGIGGRPFTSQYTRSIKDMLYLGRWDNAWDFNDHASAKIGVSGVFGPNATGPHGRTRIYGTDMMMRWRPDLARSWRALTWETEIIRRDYSADAVNDPLNPAVQLAPSERLTDWGGYTQFYWGFAPRWAAGLRFDYVNGGGGDNLDAAFLPISSNTDPFRAKRTRISPLLTWRPSEFSRLRLQYNRDRSDVLSHGVANSLWFGLEFLYGAHPAHKY